MSTTKLCKNYLLKRVDGEPIPESNKYLVLRYDKDADNGDINRIALKFWCRLMNRFNPELAEELLTDIFETEQEQ